MKISLHPLTKIAVLIAVGACVFFNPSPMWETGMVLVLFLYALLLGGRGKAVRILFFYGALLLLDRTAGLLPWDTLRLFIAAFLLLARKLIPCALAAGALVSTTPVSGFMAALSRLKVPGNISIALTVTLRYFPTLAENAEAVRSAMKMRGLAGLLKNPLRKMEYIYVPILMISLKSADTLAAAACVRGIECERKRTCYGDEGFILSDAIAGAVLLVFFLLLVLEKYHV